MLTQFFICITIVDTEECQKPRKRRRDIKNHKSFKYKQLVQKGDEHNTASGKIKPKKKFEPQGNCNCKNGCSKKISIDRQKEIFTRFYQLETWGKKVLFLRSLVKVDHVKHNLNPVIGLTEKKRLFVNNYTLTDENGIKQSVCLSFFLRCLKVSQSSIARIVKSTVTNPNALESRGKFPTRKSKEDDIEFLKDFIRKLPTYKSHYCISTETKFLDPDLSIIKLYREYSRICDISNRSKLSEWVFREIFNSKFNLRFHKLKTDTCKTCDHLESISSSTEKHEHLSKVQNTKDKFAECVQLAKQSNSKVEVLTFDLQRALPLPSLSTSTAFYKRKVYLYNLCIYDEVRGKAFHYVWHEGVASRGSQEIASCIFKHFEKNITNDCQRVIFWSDSCGGQNRNINITMMLKYFLNLAHESLESIEQNYFVSGHSYNSCDRCFGTIERERKKVGNIYIPENYNNLIKNSKKKEPSFELIEMQSKDFFSAATLLDSIKNRKKTVAGDKVNWFNIQSITNVRSEPMILSFNEYGSKIDKKISIEKTRLNISTKKLKFLYPKGRQISKKKYEDVNDLLQFIPLEFHSFYHNLKHKKSNTGSDSD